MTPVDTPWHFTTWLDLLDHWQTLIAGVFALVAAFITIRSTRRYANKQIAAIREQTSTNYLERTSDAFQAMLKAAMERVLAEAAGAKKAYPQILTQETGVSLAALAVRNCITKGAFAELRAACIRRASPLTGEFLDLEREIDSFALQCEDNVTSTLGVSIRMGKHAGLGDQLALIETKAAALREKAIKRI